MSISEAHKFMTDQGSVGIVDTQYYTLEILFKVAKRNIPILVSRSTPTDLAVGLAGELGINLVGFVRGGT